MTTLAAPHWVTQDSILSYAQKIVDLTQPDKVVWCDGSDEHVRSLQHLLIEKKTLIPLKRPGSFLARSHPQDVARMEQHTYICTPDQQDAGPTNNWMDPAEMHQTLQGLFRGAMKGRTLYIVIFAMAMPDSAYSLFGIEFTDSPYVALSMHTMTRAGQAICQAMGNRPWIPCVHSVGMPLTRPEDDTPWPFNPDHKYIVCFPEEKAIWSFGSGYGGNSLLGKKCLALRIASVMGREAGWFAEHMLIMGVEPPSKKKFYVCAAFPSSCGKTNFAMMIPPACYRDWKITTLGDDIAWIHLTESGELRAVNPENGFFGVVPGTTPTNNPHAIELLTKNTIFTNVAQMGDDDVWWEGLAIPTDKPLRDWRGQPWTPETGMPAAHPNARFTAPLAQAPSLDEHWNNPEGVPIAAFLFGGRRASAVPLITEAASWEKGVYMAATLTSETTAAATGQVGIIRQDPFAMRPFCGYNAADYFQHWLSLKNRILAAGGRLPHFYYVNWFRRHSNQQFIWPGFRENMRVLAWISGRLENTAGAQPLTYGYGPRYEDFCWTDLTFSRKDFDALMTVSPEEWQAELARHHAFFTQFGDRLPSTLYQLWEEWQQKK